MKNESDQSQRPGPVAALLRGRTIMVTRARSQSAEMTTRLESLGASVIHCPTIEVVPPSSWEQVDASIERLQDYDWIVFTSANGVEFFFHRLLQKHSHGLQQLAGRVICAIGPGTARALDVAGAVTHVVARDSKAEGALKAIADHVGGEEDIRGLRFLLPRARVGRDTLPVGLRKLDAQVDAVETYQTIRPQIDQKSIVRFFEEGSIDAITFTSSSTVYNFAALVELEDLSALLRHTLVACIGPVTAQTAAEYGLEQIIQPEVYTVNALIDALVEAIAKK